MLFNNLAVACENITPTEDIIFLPHRAGKISFGEIDVYSWNKTDKHFLSNKRFSEIHVVLFVGDQYIEAYTYGSERLSAELEVSMGTRQ